MENLNNNKGFLLISSIFVLSTMIIIVSFYLDGILQNIRVAKIIDTSPQTYYLAEAGIHEAIWRLQNNPTWKTNFETTPNWSASFTRNDALLPGGSYTVAVANQNYANALIISTSTVAVNGAESQRVVKGTVYKTLNATPVQGAAIFANEDISGVGSQVNISGGGLFANEDINLAFFSNWTTASSVKAVQDVNVSISSSLTATEGIYDQNNPPIPEVIAMPSVDFDSDDPNSYKSRADQIYSKNEFSQLLKDFPVTELNGITYVTGGIFIKKGENLTINGALVSDGSIAIGNGFSFESNPATLTIYAAAASAGLFSKKNITIGGYNSQVTVNGLIYAGGEFQIKDGITQNVATQIIGGIIAQDVSIVISWEPTDIELNQFYINQGLGEPLFSQILFINHWEEEY